MARMQTNRNSHTLLLGMWNLSVNRREQFGYFLWSWIHILCDPVTPPPDIHSRETKLAFTEKPKQKNVCSIITQKCQKLETIQMFFSW